MTGEEALDLFSQDPSLAEAYHEASILADPGDTTYIQKEINTYSKCLVCIYIYI